LLQLTNLLDHFEGFHTGTGTGTAVFTAVLPDVLGGSVLFLGNVKLLLAYRPGNGRETDPQ